MVSEQNAMSATKTKAEWMAEVEDQLGLEPEEIEPVVELFFSEAAENVPKLEAICEKGNDTSTEELKTVVRLSHSMKSSSLMLKFEDVACASAQLEKNSRVAVDEEVMLVQDFASLLGEIKENIEKWSKITEAGLGK